MRKLLILTSILFILPVFANNANLVYDIKSIKYYESSVIHYKLNIEINSIGNTKFNFLKISKNLSKKYSDNLNLTKNQMQNFSRISKSLKSIKFKNKKFIQPGQTYCSLYITFKNKTSLLYKGNLKNLKNNRFLSKFRDDLFKLSSLDLPVER